MGGVSIETADGLHVIRPTAAVRARMWLPGVIVAPLLMLFGVPLAFFAPWLTVAIVVIAIALALFGILMARLLRVEYGGGRYRYVSLFRRREFTTADVKAVHTFTSLSQSIYNFADLMVEGRDGRRLMRMPSQGFDVSALAAVAMDFEANGVPLVVTQQPVTTAQVRAAHPRLVSWFEAHQIAAALLVGLGTLVFTVILIAVIVVVLASSQIS